MSTAAAATSSDATAASASDATPPGLIAAMLTEYGALTRDALVKYLPQREPRRHFYDLVGDYPRRGGKMLRSTLCLAAARAFGGSLDAALPSAVAIELLHNALLIHDDIEDESDTRRGSPTLHALHGIPLAVHAGDGLSFLSLRPLFDNQETLGPRLAMQVLEETEQTARETAEGQAMELGWRKDNDLGLTESDYFLMVLKKTCWLTTIHPIRIGMLIGARRRLPPAAAVRFGYFLGAAFQIQDDLLNLTGDEQAYGKERDGDLLEGKRTLMLIHLYRSCTAREQARLGTILGRDRSERSARDVRWMRERMDHYGSIGHAREIVHALAGAALHEYSLLFRDVQSSRDARFIHGLVAWVFERGS